MREKTLRNSLMLSIILLGALAGASFRTAPARATSSTAFFTELNYLNSSIIAEINSANQSRNAIVKINSFLYGASGTSWNNNMTLLKSQLADIMKEATPTAYSASLMDTLLGKFDNALILAIKASDSVTTMIDVYRTIEDCHLSYNEICYLLGVRIIELGHQTQTITDKVQGLGFLFTKAKLEFLETKTSPTSFEPSTIIPLTVLIAAIATLAVASRRARRPL